MTTFKVGDRVRLNVDAEKNFQHGVGKYNFDFDVVQTITRVFEYGGDARVATDVIGDQGGLGWDADRFIPTTQKFNVGDRVMVVTPKYDFVGMTQIGDEGTIVEIRRGNLLPIRVEFEPGAHTDFNTYNAEDLVLISAAADEDDVYDGIDDEIESDWVDYSDADECDCPMCKPVVEAASYTLPAEHIIAMIDEDGEYYIPGEPPRVYSDESEALKDAEAAARLVNREWVVLKVVAYANP